MSKRITGVLFCLIAMVIYLSGFYVTAIFGSSLVAGINNWDSDLFKNIYLPIGRQLNTSSILALIVGVFYLVKAELDERKDIYEKLLNITKNKT